MNADIYTRAATRLGQRAAPWVAITPPMLCPRYDRRFGAGSQHFAKAGSAALQGDFARRRVVVSRPGQIERIHRMSGRLQPFHQRSPDQCTGKRTMYEDKSRHLISFKLIGSILLTKAAKSPV